MSSKKKGEFQIQKDVDTQEEWEEILRTNGLTVIDVYQEWSGPCKALIPTLKKIRNELSDDLLHFFTAKSDSIDSLAKYRGKCEPCFLLYAEDTLVASHRGANIPQLTRIIIEELAHEHKVMAGEAKREEHIDVGVNQPYVDDEGEEYDSDSTELAEKQSDDKIEKTFIIIHEDELARQPDDFIDDLRSRVKVTVERTFELSESEAKNNLKNLLQPNDSAPKGMYCLYIIQDKEAIEACERTVRNKSLMWTASTVEEAERELPNWIKVDQTVAVIKKDAMDYEEKIKEFIKDNGFIIAAKKRVPLKEYEAEQFHIEDRDKSDYRPLVDQICDETTTYMVLSREDAINGWQKLMQTNQLLRISQPERDESESQFAAEQPSLLYGSQSTEEALTQIVVVFGRTTFHNDGTVKERARRRKSKEKANGAVSPQSDADETRTTLDGRASLPRQSSFYDENLVQDLLDHTKSGSVDSAARVEHLEYPTSLLLIDSSMLGNGKLQRLLDGHDEQLRSSSLVIRREVSVEKSFAEILMKEERSTDLENFKFNKLVENISSGTCLALLYSNCDQKSIDELVGSSRDVKLATENQLRSLSSEDVDHSVFCIVYNSSWDGQLQELFKMEQTVMIIKPDAQEGRNADDERLKGIPPISKHSSIVDNIRQHVKAHGFKIAVRLDMKLEPDQAEKLSREQEFVKQICSDTSTVLVLSRPDAVEGLKGIAGPEDPSELKTAERERCLRGLFGENRICNAIFVSRSQEEAQDLINELIGKCRFSSDGDIVGLKVERPESGDSSPATRPPSHQSPLAGTDSPAHSAVGPTPSDSPRPASQENQQPVPADEERRPTSAKSSQTTKSEKSEGKTDKDKKERKFDDNIAHLLDYKIPEHLPEETPMELLPYKKSFIIVSSSIMGKKEELLEKFKKVGLNVIAATPLKLPSVKFEELMSESEQMAEDNPANFSIKDLAESMSRKTCHAFLFCGDENIAKHLKEKLGSREVEKNSEYHLRSSLVKEFGPIDYQFYTPAQPSQDVVNRIFKMEHTILLIKPDAQEADDLSDFRLKGNAPIAQYKSLRDHIRHRLRMEGFVICARKDMKLKEEYIKRFCNDDEHVKHIESGLCTLLVLSRQNAVQGLLDLVGPDDPSAAKKLNSRCLRAVFGTDSIQNAVFTSCEEQQAQELIRFFFGHLVYNDDGSLKGRMVSGSRPSTARSVRSDTGSHQGTAQEANPIRNPSKSVRFAMKTNSKGEIPSKPSSSHLKESATSKPGSLSSLKLSKTKQSPTGSTAGSVAGSKASVAGSKASVAGSGAKKSSKKTSLK